MYEIERKDGQVIIRAGGKPVYVGAMESSVVYREELSLFVKVSRVKDLTDEELLVALANAVDLKTPRDEKAISAGE